MVVEGLVLAVSVPRIRVDKESAGPFVPVEDAQTVKSGGACGGVRSGARVAERLGVARGWDAGE